VNSVSPAVTRARPARCPAGRGSALALAALLGAAAMSGCSSVGGGVGLSVPIGPFSIGVGVGSGGLTAGVGASAGPLSVGVGVGSGGVSAGVGASAGPVGVGASVNGSGQVSGHVGAGVSTGIGGGARVGAGVGTSTILYDPNAPRQRPVPDSGEN